MANNGNTVKWIGILVTIFILIVSAVAAMSKSGDAKLEKVDLKLDKEKLDVTVYNTQQIAEKELRDRDYKQMQNMNGKLDKLLEK